MKHINKTLFCNFFSHLYKEYALTIVPKPRLFLILYSKKSYLLPKFMFIRLIDDLN